MAVRRQKLSGVVEVVGQVTAKELVLQGCVGGRGGGGRRGWGNGLDGTIKTGGVASELRGGGVRWWCGGG